MGVECDEQSTTRKSLEWGEGDHGDSISEHLIHDQLAFYKVELTTFMTLGEYLVVTRDNLELSISFDFEYLPVSVSEFWLYTHRDTPDRPNRGFLESLLLVSKPQIYNGSYS